MAIASLPGAWCARRNSHKDANRQPRKKIVRTETTGGTHKPSLSVSAIEWRSQEDLSFGRFSIGELKKCKKNTGTMHNIWGRKATERMWELQMKPTKKRRHLFTHSPLENEASFLSCHSLFPILFCCRLRLFNAHDNGFIMSIIQRTRTHS